MDDRGRAPTFRVVRARGQRPGSEISVIGFDDTPAAALADLSSIRQPIKEAAEATADLVVAEIGNDVVDSGGRLVPATLVRRST